MRDVVAVIVTYNRKKLLERCIECVLAQEKVQCDLIIVDNASTDGTHELIEMAYGSRPELIYMNTGANLGCTGGFQAGVREAVNRGYSYVWMLDDDTLPEPDALERLITADRELQGDWGFLVSAAYWTDGSICMMNRPKTTIFCHVKEKSYHKHLKKVVMGTFVSLLVRTNVIRDVGLPIGEYFIWTDDYEYTGRISAKYPCYMVPDSKVIHAMKEHRRADFAKDDAARLGRYRYLYRNDVHCYRRYGMQGWCYILLKDFYTVFHILLHSDGHKLEKIKVVWQGAMEGLRFHPKIEMLENYQEKGQRKNI